MRDRSATTPGPRALTFRVGRLVCHALEAGRFGLDGGAMFGVVPKPLWSRRLAPDDQNRIPLALRCLLVEHPDGLVLIDTGVGNKESAKFRAIYALDNEDPRGPTRLDGALADLGYTAADIALVVNTHLHFDHAGGNTSIDPAHPAGAPVVAFPNATYVTQRGELAFAGRRNERTAGSYLPANADPVTAADRWRLLDGPAEIVPGIRALPTPGHVPHHQSILIQDSGETACFVADLIPTTHHLALPWIMGYDLEPLVTLEEKRSLLGRARDEGWVMVFEHDPDHGVGRVVGEGKSLGFQAITG